MIPVEWVGGAAGGEAISGGEIPFVAMEVTDKSAGVVADVK